jgi:hypothetical protein
MDEILAATAKVIYERLTNGELTLLLELLDAEPERAVEELRDKLHELNGAECYKPYSFGAFGLPKERDIATMLAENTLTYTRAIGMAGPKYAACVNAVLTKSPSHHTDFAGNDIVIPARSLFIKHCAWTELPAAERVLSHVITGGRKLGAKQVWLELHEENPATRGLAEYCCCRWVATKVMASSDLKGLYSDVSYGYLLEPADTIGLKELSPDWLSAEDHDAINTELAAWGDWAQHYSSYNKRQSWTAFALKGYKPADPSFIIKPREMSKKWQQENAELLDNKPEPTVAAEKFPKTMAIVDRLPGLKDRVRFMRLSAGGGELGRHADITDRDAGTRDGAVCRLHVPIVTSDAVEFSGWDHRGNHHTLRMRERGLYYLDQRKPHAVVNNDPTAERIHLVVDTLANGDLRKLLTA